MTIFNSINVQTREHLWQDVQWDTRALRQHLTPVYSVRALMFATSV